MKMSENALDLLCPMHVVVADTGRILHVGPTLRKLRPGARWTGRMFSEVFDITRPRGARDAHALSEWAGRSVQLRFCDAPKTIFKAVAAPVSEDGSAVLNLSFGIALLDAVRDYELRNTDFAPTELAMEMLYLMEAKSIATNATRQLNQRLQAARHKAESRALTDALTGLSNRRGLDAALERALRRKAQIAVMRIDLDRFKRVNDTFGHAAGDVVLRRTAEVMASEMRERDVIARVGGDEFVILLDDAPSVETVDALADRILTRITAPFFLDGNDCSVSCSLGSVQSVDYTNPAADVLLEDADQALYQSKAAGRGRHSWHRSTAGA